jgi:2-oxoglutarate ferredoxin oxidoreductase subunit beta
MDTYGFHGIHGRAPALASGVKLANPKLSVWQITGDGDALAIGGNHFIHLIRRNVNINVLLFNNRIYGLTKGQFSPTTNLGHHTKSSPEGTIDNPFNPGALVLGANGYFFARTTDTNPKEMTKIFVEAEQHQGTSIIEILQNCIIFNKDIFADYTAKDVKLDNILHVEHGERMIFGKERNKGVIQNGFKLEVVTIGENGISEEDILVHNAQEPDSTMHTMLAKLEMPIVTGVIRSVKSDTFNQRMQRLVEEVKKKSPYKTVNDLLKSGETWVIE